MINSRALKMVCLAVVPMLTLYLIKLYSVYYYSSRGIGLGFPYDSLTFNVPDRFTDWLIPAIRADQINPYHIPAAIHLPPSSYGYVTFLLLKGANVLGLHLVFVLFVVAFLVLSFLIMKEQLSQNQLTNQTLFLALVCGFYPLYFEIDRGNVQIFSAVALSAVFFCIVKRYRRIYIFLLLALLVSLKPANAFFILPIMVFANYLELIASFAVIAVNYAVPVFLPHGSSAYLIETIRSAAFTLGSQHTFCHNLSCGFRALGLPSFSIAVALGMLLATLSALLIARIRLERSTSFPLSIAIVTCAALLVADPSADYGLILLLPVFFYMLNLPIADIDDNRLVHSSGFQLVCGFVLATGFVNIYKPGVWDWYTVARSAGLLIMYLVIFRYVLSLVPVRKPVPKSSEELRGEIA